MSYNIVFLDIDGTILTHNQTIPESTKKAVKELKEKGLEVVIATGRGIYETEHIADALEITSTITYNGAYVLYKGKEIFKKPLQNQKVLELIELVSRNKDSLSCHGLKRKYYTNIQHQVVQDAIHAFEFKNSIISNTLEEVEDIYQMIMYCETKEQLLRYQHTMPGLKLSIWNTTFNCADVTSSTMSKAEGIEKLLEYLNINKENAAAFGDGLNDVEMLSYVGGGVAMGNAHPDLFPYAKFKTKPVDEDGIYFGLQQLGIL